MITHGPPYKIRDEVGNAHVGCEDLYRKIIQTEVKLHVFGHIHEGAGYAYLNGRTYVNASSLLESYQFKSPGYLRIIKQEGRYSVLEQDK